MAGSKQVKLGLKPARRDHRTQVLAHFLAPEVLPTPPSRYNVAEKVPLFPMFSNDKYGNCGLVSRADFHIAVTAHDGHPFMPTEASVLEDYQRVGGWNPYAELLPDGSNPTDQGIVLIDGMNDWRINGACGGRKIGAYASVMNHSNLTPNQLHLQRAIWMFGGVICGFELPAGVDGAESWDVPRRIGRLQRAKWDRGSWGGHAVVMLGYDGGRFLIASWGGLIWVSMVFIGRYLNEGYVPISPDWLGPDNSAPSGFDGEQLLTNLKRIGALAR